MIGHVQTRAAQCHRAAGREFQFSIPVGAQVTLFAGAVCLGAARLPLPDVGALLSTNLSRRSSDQPTVHRHSHFVIAHVDLGLTEPGNVFEDSAGRVSLLAGLPLLDASGARTRAQDLQSLHAAAITGDHAVLQSAHGEYCFAFVDPAHPRAVLATDNMGLRPMFHVVVDGVLYFSTTLRVLEFLPPVPKRANYCHVAQLATLGYLSGDATPYHGIAKLRAGHTVHFTASGADDRAYHSWDAIKPDPVDGEERLDILFSTFNAAVGRRRSGATEVAHLSGGLDSRCVVAALRGQGASVHTLNFAPDGSADRVLGKMAADELGAIHFERHHGEPDFWQRMVTIHDEWQAQATSQPKWTRQVWAGFDGELVLAPVNITASIAAQMRAGDTDGAIAQFLAREGAALPGRLITDKYRAGLTSANADAVRNEIGRSGCADPARRLHLYALLNETRGQLAQHYEDIDLRRLEFLMPFYDTKFLTFVLSQPLDVFAEHRLYHRWLSRFQPATTRVPWQTYEGHESCPLPIPPALRLQGDSWYTPDERRRITQLALAQLACDLDHPGFPRHVLRRPVLQIARWLTRLGLERYEYLFPIAHTFVRYSGETHSPAVPLTATAHSAQGWAA